jgi:hypothetical protein
MLDTISTWTTGSPPVNLDNARLCCSVVLKLSVASSTLGPSGISTLALAEAFASDPCRAEEVTE